MIRRDPQTEAAADVKLFELGFREAKDPRLEPGTLELPAKRMAQVTKDLVAGRLAGRGRGEADPPGRRVQAGRDHRHRLVRARRRRSTSAARASACPTCWPPPAAARRWSSWATARWACSPRSGSRSTACSPTWAPPRTAASGSAAPQAGLLDALLAAQPEIQVDAAFEQGPPEPPPVRGGRSRSTRPPGFHGELRPYQREGLGWLDYLQQFGFGGILADDMGLGKTIQVLALLQRRRARRQAKGPSLAVVPRSLVFNWIAGGRASSPRRLRVLDYTGPGRHALRETVRATTT